MLATPSEAIPNDPVEAEEPQAEENETPSEPTLSPDVVAHLGEQLQAFYARLMNDPVPDHLVRLIESLDRSGNGRDGE